MEDLPDDALLIILNKLAVQDLPSLFQVASVSKRFYQIVTARITACPEFWRQAFYGPTPWVDDGSKSLFDRKRAELESRLESLQFFDDQMPYRRLVEPRRPYASFQTAFRKGRPASDPAEQPRPVNFEHSDFQATCLFVIRLRGGIILWGFEDHVSLEDFRATRRGYRVHGQILPKMQPQYPTDKVFEALSKLDQDPNDVVGLSLEVHTVLTTTHEPKSRLGFAFWRGEGKYLLLQRIGATNQEFAGLQASLSIHCFGKTSGFFGFRRPVGYESEAREKLATFTSWRPDLEEPAERSPV